MGLDIFFRKVRHAKPFAEGTRQRLEELRNEWRNAYYDLPNEQYELINADATKKEALAADILMPIYEGIKNEVDKLLSKTKDDDLKTQVSVRLPNLNEVLDPDNCFVMGDYCKNEVAYFRKVNFLLPAFNYQENCSDIEVTKCATMFLHYTIDIKQENSTKRNLLVWLQMICQQRVVSSSVQPSTMSGISKMLSM